jgi:hypothetical protein
MKRKGAEREGGRELYIRVSTHQNALVMNFGINHHIQKPNIVMKNKKLQPLTLRKHFSSSRNTRDHQIRR